MKKMKIIRKNWCLFYTFMTFHNVLQMFVFLFHDWMALHTSIGSIKKGEGCNGV